MAKVYQVRPDVQLGTMSGAYDLRIMADEPAQPCYRCRGTQYRYTLQAGWVCVVCHPVPAGPVEDESPSGAEVVVQ